MTVRVGTDLIEIDRIRRALERYDRFRERCFTEAERAYCDSRPNPAQSYAGRFAGKEAVGNDVRFQATITKTARECVKAGSEITARVGIQGRVIAGPAGAPDSIEVPLRVAVVQGGVTEKVIATKGYKTTVAMAGENVPFTLVADDLVYPIPPGAVGDSYIFYIGFDPQLVSAEKPKPVKKKK